MTDTVSKQSAFAVFIQPGAVVAKQSVNSVFVWPGMRVAKHSVVTVFLPAVPSRAQLQMVN